MLENLVNQVPMFVVVLLLILGFVLLIKGADFFVGGSSSIAKRLQVPSVIIGLTVVAMGTSLPETAVSVTASLAGNNELAISNAVGSNIFNLMVVIGFCAMMTPIMVEADTIKKDIPFSALCAVLLLGLGFLGIFDAQGMTLGHVDGAIFLVIFAIYIVVLVRRAMKGRKESANKENTNKESTNKESTNKENSEVAIPNTDGEEEIKELSIVRSIIYIILGAAGIAIGGDLTVDSASRIATTLGMSQTLVGLTIVSIGTSLPELVTSIVAAKKHEIGMALGNAIGSNVFNILMVLGIASAISPIAFIQENVIDIIVLLVFTLIVWIFAASKKRLDKFEGAIMLACYIGYSVYIFMR